MSEDLNLSVTEVVDRGGQDFLGQRAAEAPLVTLSSEQVSKILLLLQKQTDSIQREVRQKEAKILMQKGNLKPYPIKEHSETKWDCSSGPGPGSAPVQVLFHALRLGFEHLGAAGGAQRGPVRPHVHGGMFLGPGIGSPLLPVGPLPPGRPRGQGGVHAGPGQGRSRIRQT